MTQPDHSVAVGQATVVVHFNQDGEITYHATGDVRLLIVDDRAPHDRVYEYRGRSDPAAIKALLGDDTIGSSSDSRHAAVAARITAADEGRAHLQSVPDAGFTGFSYRVDE